jgi:hypothetical protein
MCSPAVSGKWGLLKMLVRIRATFEVEGTADEVAQFSRLIAEALAKTPTLTVVEASEPAPGPLVEGSVDPAPASATAFAEGVQSNAASTPIEAVAAIEKPGHVIERASVLEAAPKPGWIPACERPFLTIRRAWLEMGSAGFEYSERAFQRLVRNDKWPMVPHPKTGRPQIARADFEAILAEARRSQRESDARFELQREAHRKARLAAMAALPRKFCRRCLKNGLRVRAAAGFSLCGDCARARYFRVAIARRLREQPRTDAVEGEANGVCSQE